jgi:hypothetical protein
VVTVAPSPMTTNGPIVAPAATRAPAPIFTGSTIVAVG